jgi:MFS family permease
LHTDSNGGTPTAPVSAPGKLWTRDFTIITLGSMVSLLGNAISGFSMSLMVLDYTDSSFLYAIYIAVYTLPQIIMPVFSGALLDRFSRKRMIYTLDYISACLYAWLPCCWVGAGSASPSGVLLLPDRQHQQRLYRGISELLSPAHLRGNYSKAYSISSVLETLAVLMVPVATFAYNKVGIAPLLGVNAVLFAIAATVETGYAPTRSTSRPSGRRWSTPVARPGTCCSATYGRAFCI